MSERRERSFLVPFFFESSVLGCEILALFSMLGLFVTLPFVWRTARQYELCRDVADWAEEDDGVKEAMNDGEYYSGSDDSLDDPSCS
eukprot:s2098_g4.t1